MKISVVIPTYNRAEIVSRAIKSVQNQTLQPFEIIVIDDGSNDDTRRTIKEQFSHCRYHHQENQGVSSARNLGIQKAKSEWIAFPWENTLNSHSDRNEYIKRRGLS